jgi:hypothetical protein
MALVSARFLVPFSLHYTPNENFVGVLLLMKKELRQPIEQLVVLPEATTYDLVSV